jgi:hypothetical protein
MHYCCISRANIGLLEELLKSRSDIRMRLMKDEEVLSKLVVSLIMLQQCCSLNSKLWSCPLAATVSPISELLTHYFGNLMSYNHFTISVSLL